MLDLKIEEGLLMMLLYCIGIEMKCSKLGPNSLLLSCIGME